MWNNHAKKKLQRGKKNINDIKQWESNFVNQNKFSKWWAPKHVMSKQVMSKQVMSKQTMSKQVRVANVDYVRNTNKFLI